MNRDQLRAAMPQVAAIVDEFRHLMADGGKLIYASENGKVIDRREPVDPARVFTIPPNYYPCTPMQTKEKRNGKG